MNLCILLKDKDDISYLSIHPNNIKRVIRALEVYKVSGNPFSYYMNSKHNSQYKFLYFVLTMDRLKLYDRINKKGWFYDAGRAFKWG